MLWQYSTHALSMSAHALLIQILSVLYNVLSILYTCSVYSLHMLCQCSTHALSMLYACAVSNVHMLCHYSTYALLGSTGALSVLYNALLIPCNALSMLSIHCLCCVHVVNVLHMLSMLYCFCQCCTYCLSVTYSTHALSGHVIQQFNIGFY